MPSAFSRAFNRGGTFPFSKKKSYDYSSDFFTALTSDEEALVVGWLAQRKQFGIIGVTGDLTSLELFCDVNCVWSRNGSTDWGYCEIKSRDDGDDDDDEPLHDYITTVGRHNRARTNKPAMVGWCSWYHYYEKITLENLTQNVSKLKEWHNNIPWNACVIDDGYMTKWGDWTSLKPGAFPSPDDLKLLRNVINDADIRPGLWLAPYAADKGSALSKRHPEWIIRNHGGSPANSANCGKFFYGLDGTNPDVRQYAHDMLENAVARWGYKVLKLDFLYASCLAPGSGRYDLSMTRAEAMDLALKSLRHAVGEEVYLIGCGCPLGSGIGIVDAMRVSADTGPTWYPTFPLPWWDNSTLPALRAAIRNTLTRSPISHRWWQNDPDCLLVAPTTSLTLSEIKSAATVVAMTSGSLLLSDDLNLLTEERLRIIQGIVPVTGSPAKVLDLHENKTGIPAVTYLRCISSLKEVEELSHRLHPRGTLRVCDGVGEYSIVSLSNWNDETAVVAIDIIPLLPPRRRRKGGGGGVSGGGYHIWAYWSERYVYLSHSELEGRATYEMSTTLESHASEIFILRECCGGDNGGVQYVASNLHFTCGWEVEELRYFDDNKQGVEVFLKTEGGLKGRKGSVFLYVPGKSSGDDGVEMVVGEVNDEDIIGRVVKVDVDAGGNEGRGRIVYPQ